MKFVFIILVAWGGTSWAGERFFEQSFEVEPNATFSLDSHKGHIQIRTGTVSTVQVNARIYTEEGDDRILDFVEIQTKGDPRYVSINVEFDQDGLERGFSGLVGKHQSWPFVDFDIVLPQQMDLRVDSHKSSFDVQAPAGRVRIQSHKGNGTIREVRGDFKLETHKGEFEVEILQLGDLEIETHKGNVHVAIHAATDFTVRADSHKGRFAFKGYDIPIRRDEDDREIRVQHTVGNGGSLIDIETHKGDVTLEFIH